MRLSFVDADVFVKISEFKERCRVSMLAPQADFVGIKRVAKNGLTELVLVEDEGMLSGF